MNDNETIILKMIAERLIDAKALFELLGDKTELEVKKLLEERKFLAEFEDFCSIGHFLMEIAGK